MWMIKERSDLELIEEAEKRLYNKQAPTYDAIRRNFGKDLAASVLLMLPELASRLKSANEKLAKVAQEDEDMAGMPSTSPTLARLFKTRAEALRR